ncbi:arginine beta-hydroxylase, Fe(II)/alpha-ketoglutarate-dependent [Amycolatopsis antarctica]|uniref:Arginine beta-hydroxylase, Fe(II)/alpha-ketoglutarate-dependent n=1 Tax=Amycolatopsis antarctica TaxID=1854586 RepID=A0A263D3H5_9PSEU|nr:guanitoxin biosynthesis L-enduracididine beta-hydroxylase GntD [Amycolatopsis antarctica]OZM72921.1 arginine beta-hydroxylase, Fe(II)/alpha-ketoglutarate-dependent [Amycolatopsis antarctica]
MFDLTIDDREAREVGALLDDLAGTYSTVEDPAFQRRLPVHAHELPVRVREHLTTFRLGEPAGVCVISGCQVDQDRVGPTPAHWRDQGPVSPALREEIFILLCGSLLGDPIGWSTQHDGRFVHDVLPVPGDENEQIGTGSAQTITWHVEDAFHPFRGDYVGLMCLRNPDKVATTYADMADLEIDEETAEVLAEPRFYIRPDNSHLNGASANGTVPSPGAARLMAASRERILGMHNDPEPVPVLFGADHAPYLRLDPYFMDFDRMDQEAAVALKRLSAEIDRNLREATLAPGDVCFVDNFRAVHGRNEFTARYDGTDRWLKRVNVARDLRKSREARLHAESRIIF